MRRNRKQAGRSGKLEEEKKARREELLSVKTVAL
jgi:hypothetical protein